MILAKKNVLVVLVSKTNHDKYGNRYSKVSRAYIIKPEKNERVYLDIEEYSSYHSSDEQVGHEFAKKTFSNITGQIWEYKNIVVSSQIVKYKQL